MPEHYLIERATRTPHRERPDLPKGIAYDPRIGYWLRGDKPLFSAAGQRPATKKRDIETGEDMKGE